MVPAEHELHRDRLRPRNPRWTVQPPRCPNPRSSARHPSEDELKWSVRTSRRENELCDVAVSLIDRRLSSVDSATAAALRLDDGSITVGICLDNFSSAAGLCAEAGPISAARSNDQKVIAADPSWRVTIESMVALPVGERHGVRSITHALLYGLRQ